VRVFSGDSAMDECPATHFRRPGQFGLQILDSFLSFSADMASQLRVTQSRVDIIDDDTGLRDWLKRSIHSVRVEKYKLRDGIPATFNQNLSLLLSRAIIPVL
jgi:hypothetical protein